MYLIWRYFFAHWQLQMLWVLNTWLGFLWHYITWLLHKSIRLTYYDNDLSLVCQRHNAVACRAREREITRNTVVYVSVYQLNSTLCRSVMNYSVAELAIKMMTTMMMMMSIGLMSIITLSVYTMASQQLLTYCPIHAPNGTRLCAVTNPFMPFEILEADKLTRCAVSSMSLNAVMFNYKENQTDSQCTVFHSLPFHYQHTNDCVGYQVNVNIALVTI